MPKSMGQIIKNLRKERNLTQEELAELLNVSGQAVSKWENDTSMPDISQVVPIAKVFGVSVDVLFDTFGTRDDDEVDKIIADAQKLTYDSNNIVNNEGLYKGYLVALDGLNRYPNNIKLLMFVLECGLSLSYPDNDCYDPIHAKEIYANSIRQANIVISYAKNTTDVLRTHMIMVLLHSANGNTDRAWEHANQFPWRADMTLHEMSAYIAHSEKNYADEALYCQRDFMYHLESMLDDMTQNGCAYLMTEKYEDAIKTFGAVFDIIGLVFSDEEVMPSLHLRERGDVHTLLAEAYLKAGDTENALKWLGRMVEYDIDTRARFANDMMVQTPLLRDVKYTFYWIFRSRAGDMIKLLDKLNATVFQPLSDNAEYKALIERVNQERDIIERSNQK